MALIEVNKRIRNERSYLESGGSFEDLLPPQYGDPCDRILPNLSFTYSILTPLNLSYLLEQWFFSHYKIFWLRITVRKESLGWLPPGMWVFLPWWWPAGDREGENLGDPWGEWNDLYEAGGLLRDHWPGAFCPGDHISVLDILWKEDTRWKRTVRNK